MNPGALVLSLFGVGLLKDLTAGELRLSVPRAWTVVPNNQLLLELHVGKNGDRGVLQISRLGADGVSALTGKDLGAAAVKFGEVNGRRGQNWGRAIGSKHVPCTMGQLGMAIFAGGEFPSMIVWLTVSSSSAYLWTWLGPDPVAGELEDAVKAVMGATVSSQKSAPVKP